MDFLKIFSKVPFFPIARNVCILSLHFTFKPWSGGGGFEVFIEKKLQHLKNPYNLIFLTLIEKFILPANFQMAILQELIEQMTSNFKCFGFSLI